MVRRRKPASAGVGYELWDNMSLNLIDEFAGEAEALAAVRDVVRRYGPDAVETWGLDPTDRRAPRVSGKALIARALGAVAA